MRKSKQDLKLGTGDRIDSLLKQMGLAPWEMAAKLGITQGCVSRYRSGTMLPGTAMLKRFFTEYGLSMNWLLFGHGPQKIESIDRALAALSGKQAETVPTVQTVQPGGGTGLEMEKEAIAWRELAPDVKDLIVSMQGDPLLRYDMLIHYHKYKIEKERTAGEK